MKHCLPYIIYISCFVFSLVIVGCKRGGKQVNNDTQGESVTLYQSAKPYTRWWWFASEIKKKDVQAQLSWVKEQGFGGVEIAWLYPLYRMNKNITRNTADHPQIWLSEAWTEIVQYAAHCCDSLGLGCDFTVGSGWPFGDSYVKKSDGVQIFGDTAFDQKISFSWEYPVYGRVINHLSKTALLHYAGRIGKALHPALKGSRSTLFCDSWEIKLNAHNKLWTNGFDNLFKTMFNYDIVPYMEKGIDNFPDVRYDYMKCLSKNVIDSFYIPFTEFCHSMNIKSRVQCLASPTDVMEAYAMVDIPETEAMLNNPVYSRIVSSAAALAGRKIVSSETFTCMYGFPDKYIREEQTADLKMVSDALFAQGVNQIFWHGMPFNRVGEDTVNFFASVYVGRKGSLTPELPELNEYIRKVCSYMQKGKTYGQIAVYIPWEDRVMAGAYPPERQRVWVWGQYEMRYTKIPEELNPYCPLWVNRYFLKNAEVKNNKLLCGDVEFEMLYLDVHYLDIEAIKTIIDIAKKGVPVCLKQFPFEPGFNKSKNYRKLVFDLASLPNVNASFKPTFRQFITCDTLLDYWVREDNGNMYIFFANPVSHNLEYPITSGQSFTTTIIEKLVHINRKGQSIALKLRFKPYQSLLLKIDEEGVVEYKNIYFLPNEPVIKPSEKVPMYF